MARLLRPVDLGRAVGVSASTVRKYEGWGFLPPAERGPTGYRGYTERHVQALRVARTLMAGYGWQPAARLLQLVHRGDLAAAYAAVNAAHAALHRERLELEQLLAVLRTVAAGAAQPGSDTQPGNGSPELTGLLVGEAARHVGVTVAAVRFWEARGLLAPTRDASSRYRRYDTEQLRRLSLVVLLRKAGYDFATIRSVLERLRSGEPDQAVEAAERRLAELTESSRRHLAGTAALWHYLNAPPEQAEG